MDLDALICCKQQTADLANMNKKMDLIKGFWVAYKISRRARHGGITDKSNEQNHVTQSWCDEDTIATRARNQVLQRVLPTQHEHSILALE